MAQRYSQGYDENKNVANPDFFEEGMRDLAGEFNGGLDRDNFPQAALLASEINTEGGTVRVFTTAESSLETSTPYQPDRTNTGWQGGAATRATGIFYQTWTALQDEHVDLAANLYWLWNGSYSWVPNGAARPDRRDTFDTVMYQIVVDGVVVATAGPFEDGAQQWSCYMCGAIQLAAGEHTLRVECLTVRRVVQTGALDGECTNQITISDRSLMVLRSLR